MEEKTTKDQQVGVVKHPAYLTSKIKMYRETEAFEFSGAFVNDTLINHKVSHDLLHQSEIQELEKLSYERRKRSFALGRLSAKLALNELANDIPSSSIHIESGVFGFPVIHCAEMKSTQVSITHSGSLGVSIAFDEKHPMGIDLEKINLKNAKAISNQISTNEQSLLREIGKLNLEGFTAIWSAKEALSKILKTGMMIEFGLLEINHIEVQQETLMFEFKNFGQYKALCHTNAQYAIALVLPKKTTVNVTEFWNIFNLSTLKY